MSQLEGVVEASTLDPKVRDLIKLRDSQINGCAYYVDMRAKDVRAMGKDAQRLHLARRARPGHLPPRPAVAPDMLPRSGVICSSSTARTKNVDVDRGP